MAKPFARSPLWLELGTCLKIDRIQISVGQGSRGYRPSSSRLLSILLFVARVKVSVKTRKYDGLYLGTYSQRMD